MNIKILLLFTLTLCFLVLPRAWSAWPQLRGRDEARQQELRKRLGEIRLERPRIFLTNTEIDTVRNRIENIPSVLVALYRLVR